MSLRSLARDFFITSGYNRCRVSTGNYFSLPVEKIIQSTMAEKLKILKKIADLQFKIDLLLVKSDLTGEEKAKNERLVEKYREKIKKLEKEYHDFEESKNDTKPTDVPESNDAAEEPDSNIFAAQKLESLDKKIPPCHKKSLLVVLFLIVLGSLGKGLT